MVAQLNNQLEIKESKMSKIIDFINMKLCKRKDWDMSNIISNMFESMIINSTPKKTGLIDYYELHDKVYPLLDKKSEIDVLVFILKRTILSRRSFEYIKIDEIINGVKEGKEIYTTGTNLSKNTVLSAIKILISRNIIFKHEFSRTKDHLYILNTPLGKDIYSRIKSKEFKKDDIDQLIIDTRKRKITYQSLYQTLNQVSANIEPSYTKPCTKLVQTLNQVSANIEPSSTAVMIDNKEIKPFQKSSTSVLPSVLPSVLTNTKIEVSKNLENKKEVFEEYKDLRKNDPQYLELLKQVCNDTSEETLKDWLEARPFIEISGNIPYYLLNSIQNKRQLPEGYLKQKSEKIKNELFEKWSNPYQKIIGRKINYSMIENNLSDLVANIIKTFDFVRNYFTSKDFEYKCDEKNIRQVKANQEFLKEISKVLKVSELQDLVRTILSNESLKNRSRFLLDLKDINSVISSILMINDYSSKEV